MKYTKRVAEKTFRRLLKAFPIVGITGPRQSVKSTLLKHLLKDYTYVTFDDIRKVQLLKKIPSDLLKDTNIKSFLTRYNLFLLSLQLSKWL